MVVDYEYLKKQEEARNVALKKIGYRLRTEKEIRDILKKEKIDSNLIEDTVSFLKEYDYINDSLYAKAYFKDQKARLIGEHRIVQELKKKGISSFDIKEGYNILLDEGESSTDLINASLLYSKIKNEQAGMGKEIDDKFKARVIRRLMSKGYSNDIIMKVIKSDGNIR